MTQVACEYAPAAEVSCCTVWPWEEEPYRLWSLFDMLHHLGGNWHAIANNLERLRWLIVLCPKQDDALQQFLTVRGDVCRWLGTEINEMPFSVSLRRQVARLTDTVNGLVAPVDETTASMLCARIDELNFNIQSELEEQLFFVVPASHKKWFTFGDVAIFGTAVADAFPDSTPDIAEAGRCYALDRWTASVFHLMRALELALHKWARELGVDQFSAIELENWKNILDAAEKKVKELDGQSKSATKDKELKYYGETLGRYRAIKDAWRNHVAHARERYDEGRALSILNNVKEFMSLLAARP